MSVGNEFGDATLALVVCVIGIVILSCSIRYCVNKTEFFTVHTALPATIENMTSPQNSLEMGVYTENFQPRLSSSQQYSFHYVPEATVID